MDQLCQYEEPIQIHSCALNYYSMEEQEFVYLVSYKLIDGIETEVKNIECSIPKIMQNLFRDKYFHLTRIIISQTKANRILSIEGFLNNKKKIWGV